MSNYRLINPCLEGNIVNTFNGKSNLDAALSAWTTLSQYITNNVPRFAFTLENTRDGGMCHFMVEESLTGGNKADYNISQMNIKMKSSEEKEFKKRSSAFSKSKKGGRPHKKDDDDSSSDSDELYSTLKLHKMLTKQTPISYLWYDPMIYKFESLYIPTFVAPLTPYIEVSTINYYP